MIKELFIEKDSFREGSKFYHKQVFFNGMFYIYQVGHSADDSNPWYEIFKRKIVPDVISVEGKLKASETDFHVKYPSNEAFGKWAFCCHDVECISRALHDGHEIDKPIRDIFKDCLNGVDEWLSEAQKGV